MAEGWDGLAWQARLGYVREAGMTWGEREGVTELGKKYLEPVQLKPLHLWREQALNCTRKEEKLYILMTISHKLYS